MKNWWQHFTFKQQTIIIVCAMLLSYGLSYKGFYLPKNFNKYTENANCKIINNLKTVLNEINNDIKLKKIKTSFDIKQFSNPEYNLNTHYYYQIYENNNLKIWSTNKALPNYLNYKNSSDSLFGIHYGNTFFISYKKKLDSNNFLWACIPIKDQYVFTNTILENYNYKPFCLNHLTAIDTQKFTNSIPLKYNNKPLFYTYTDNVNIFFSDISIVEILYILSLIPFILLTYLLFLHLIKKYNKIKCFTLFASILLLHRLIYYLFGYTSNIQSAISHNNLTDSFNFYFNSIGDFTLTYIILFFIALIFRIKILPINITIKNLYWKYIVKMVIGLIFTFLAYKIYIVVENVIQYTSINFEVSILENLNLHTLVGYFLIILGEGFTLTLISIYVELVNKFFENNLRQKLISFTFCNIIFWLIFILVYKTVLLTDIFFSSWIIVSYLIMSVLQIRNLKGRFNYNTLIWIVFIAASTTVFIRLKSNDKIKSTLVEIASQFVPDRDLLLESKFDDLIKSIDLTVVDSLKNGENIEELFKSKNLLTINSSLIFNYDSGKNIMCDSLFDAGEISLTGGNVSYISNITKDCYYLLRIKSTANNYIYIFCNQIPIEQYIKYPDFIKFNTLQNNQWIDDNEEYKIAFYENNILKYTNTDLILPFSKNISENIIELKKENYKVIQYSNGKYSCVLAKQLNSIMNNIILFSFTFSWLFVLIIIGLFSYHFILANFNFKQFIKNIHLNFQSRFFILLVVLEICIFILFIYFVNTYSEKTIETSENNKIEYSGKILNNLFSDISLKDNNYYFNSNSLNTFNDIPKKYNFYFNIYDSTGILIFSSLPVIHQLQLENNLLNPYILHNNSSNNSFQQKILTENFSSYNYKVWFQKIDVNSKKYFLTIPNYQQFSNLKKAKLLIIAPIIDSLVILLVITSLISFLLARYLMSKLKMLSEKMNKFNLSNNNSAEFLEWNYLDEIKPLVENYNIMVAHVESAAKKLAENERDSAWREMAKQVAHEIKNPLTPIRLTLQKLQRSIENKNENVEDLTKKAIKNIIEQIDTLNQIALNFSKFGQMPPSTPEIFSLNELLKNSIYTNLKTDENVKIIFKECSKNVFVNLDKDQLTRILNNLILNAIQSIPNGKIGLVEIKQEVLFAITRITVKDNGLGIADTEKDKIFHPYFTTKSSGTGLGLAISKDIIDSFGGALNFNSKLNVGTEFYLDIPVFIESDINTK